MRDFANGESVSFGRNRPQVKGLRPVKQPGSYEENWPEIDANERK
jgi:hypothetical protein